MSYFNRIKFIYLIVCLLLATGLMFQFLAGCGGDDGPVNPITVLPSDDGVPEKPKMTDPDDDPPNRSESLLVFEATPGFFPEITKGKGHVKVKGRAKLWSTSGLGIDCEGDWNNNVFSGTEWTDQLANVTAKFGGCGLLSDYTKSNLSINIADFPSDKRFWLVKDGKLVASPDSVTWTGSYGNSFCRERIPIIGTCTSGGQLKLAYGFKGKKLTNVPLIARERFWQLTPWESGNLVEGIEGEGSIEAKSSYTAGSSLSETQSMSLTLTSEGGVEFEGVSAKVTASINTTFSSTVVFEESKSKEFSRTLVGEAGKRNLFVLWVLKERYSFVNADGTPYYDQNYDFPETKRDPQTGRPYMFEIAGGRAEAVVYHFDLKSNKMLGMETLH